ncbi:hypothetical protein [Clostridioides difficile]|uniref:Uncharacterized protein n=1 Tax=Clostridioides difficile NAP08 TaxID=525259 RepID=D5Q8Q9_CLODI|nr:hypothetical protein [Clostridioides difficile]EFH05736.1 hypothetical protein HMPREF0220_3293 [Clostridioides difficile NAP08]EFH17135.1 hypothetical protein HMPREF0219_0245 [Clostridioides difficile NAP07]CCK88241.1 conserved hypothetical protein [Clostridioides difficile T5]CCK91669.1 conserved hypothetical protein [Clostridioides difficile T20]CCK95379.1 conserved hypothetical protein [Clostridioides difficile E1]CCK99365.1 conserved hypothetical protein [Clostridioides difficile E10]
MDSIILINDLSIGMKLNFLELIIRNTQRKVVISPDSQYVLYEML